MTDAELRELLTKPDRLVDPAASYADELERRLVGALEGDIPALPPQPGARRIQLVLGWAAAAVLVAVLVVIEVGSGGPEPVLTGSTVEPVTSITTVDTTLTTGGVNESISVSSELVAVGPGLAVQDLAQFGERTFVSAGRLSTRVGDQPPEVGVVAAFDPSGDEVWRTELTDNPTLIAADSDSVWVAQFGTGTAVRLHPETGEILESVRPVLPTPIGGGPDADQFIPIGLETGFDSVWMHTIRGAVARIEPDGSWTAVEIPAMGPHGLAVGAGAVWVALGNDGVGRINEANNELSTISAEVIGHGVDYIAADNEAVFVGAGIGNEPGQVTSIVANQIQATVNLESPIRHLGRVFGVFGVLTQDARLTELIPEEPMIIDVEVAFGLDEGGVYETQGNAWLLDYPSAFRLIQLGGSESTSPLPLTEPTEPRPIPDQYVLSPDWEQLPEPPVDPPWPGNLVWTGSEIVIFGGEPPEGGSQDTAFNPTTDSWRLLNESVGVEVDPRIIETNQLLQESGLSPNSRDGAWIGEDLVGVDYLFESSLYDSSDEAWHPGVPVPLAFTECSVKVHAVEQVAVVDSCGRLAVGGPDAWTPLSGPIVSSEDFPTYTAGAGTLWAYSREGIFRLTADLEDPTSFRRLPLGPTILILPEGWSLRGLVEANPISIELTGPEGSCTTKAYTANAGPLLSELARNGFQEVSIEPAVGGKPYSVIEYTADDGSVHLAGAPFSTSVVDVGCPNRQTAVALLRSTIWPWQ